MCLEKYRRWKMDWIVPLKGHVISAMSSLFNVTKINVSVRRCGCSPNDNWEKRNSAESTGIAVGYPKRTPNGIILRTKQPLSMPGWALRKAKETHFSNWQSLKRPFWKEQWQTLPKPVKMKNRTQCTVWVKCVRQDYPKQPARKELLWQRSSVKWKELVGLESLAGLSKWLHLSLKPSFIMQ